MKTKSTKQQSGFSVLTLLIAAVAIFGVLTAAVSMSRSGASVTGDSMKPIASALITQGNNLATAFQSATARGIDASAVTYDSGTYGLLNPSNTGLAPQVPPAQAFSASYASSKLWVYEGTVASGTTTPTIKVRGVGVEGNADYVFAVAGLSKAVCSEINKQLGFAPNSGTDYSEVFSAAVATGNLTTPAAIDLTGTAVTASGTGNAFSGHMQSCLKGSTDYFFYVVVQPQ